MSGEVYKLLEQQKEKLEEEITAVNKEKHVLQEVTLVCEFVEQVDI